MKRSLECDQTAKLYGIDTLLCADIKIVHFASKEQVEGLFPLFSKLTEQGWVAPHWLSVMHSRCY